MPPLAHRLTTPSPNVQADDAGIFAAHKNTQSLNEIQQTQKRALTYIISKCTHTDADHRRAAKDSIFYLLGLIENAFSAQLPPNLLQAQYISKPRAFILTMPGPLADAATRLAPLFAFQAESSGCKYKLELDKHATLTPAKKSSTDSHNYLWTELPAGFTLTDQLTADEIAKHLSKAGLAVTEHHHYIDPETGTLTPRFRVAFNPTERFNVYMISSLRNVGVNGFQLKLHFSYPFCNAYKLHADCLKFFRGPSAPKEAVDADICSCIHTTVKPRARSDPYLRQAAQNAYQERLKRKRQITDADF